MRQSRKSVLAAGAIAFAMAFNAPAWAGTPSAGTPTTVASPDGKIRVELSSSSGNLAYRITVDGKQVIAPSRLGIRSDNVELGQEVSLGKPGLTLSERAVPLLGSAFGGRESRHEATVPATSHGESYAVDLHVANDGVAVRLRLPAKPGRKVQADRSSWMLEGDPTMWVDKLDFGYEAPTMPVRSVNWEPALWACP